MNYFRPDPKPEKPIRLKGKKLRKLRQDCYDRAMGLCEAENDKGHRCRKAAPWSGGVFVRGHMAHIKSRGAGGSDTLDNVLWKCPECHLQKEHGPQWSFRKNLRRVTLEVDE